MALSVRPVNRRALRKYGEFWRALQLVGTALVEAERHAAKAGDAQPARASAGLLFTGPLGPPKELRSAANKAGQSLHGMANAAKKWEAELISREWRR